MSSYRYRKSHWGDKTILRPSFPHNRIFYTGNTTSLYWIRAQDGSSHETDLVCPELSGPTPLHWSYISCIKPSIYITYSHAAYLCIMPLLAPMVTKLYDKIWWYQAKLRFINLVYFIFRLTYMWSGPIKHMHLSYIWIIHYLNEEKTSTKQTNKQTNKQKQLNTVCVIVKIVILVYSCFISITRSILYQCNFISYILYNEFRQYMDK